MNSLFVILTIIIILAIFYLIYRNNQYNKVLESFDNSTQSSLSTFFQSTVDKNSLDNRKNIYNGVYVNKKNSDPSNVDWNGVWESTDDSIYSQIINLNDKILIALSNTDLNQTLQNINNNTSTAQCPPNTFIGIGTLNKNKTIFTVYKIICNNLQNSSLNLQENKLAGKIDNTNTYCTLYSDDKASQITLRKIYSLNYDSPNFYGKNSFLQKIAPEITNYPIMPNSSLTYNKYYCTNSTPCKVNNLGLGDAFDNLPINACGQQTSGVDNTCSGTPQCIWYTPAPTGYTTCDYTQEAFDYLNFAGINTMYNSNNNTLETCDNIRFFGKNGFNSNILCYVTNLGLVQTLNYEFFGSLHNESNLTMQQDMMGEILNLPSGLLDKYRKVINTGVGNPRKAVSFTNCVELNDSSSTMQQVVTNCQNQLKQMASSFKPANNNTRLYPCVWTINNNSNGNVLNSCPITLSTSSLYNTPVKYVEFNNNGDIALSLYPGGINQNLYITNSKIITSTPSNVIMTCNIKNNAGLYLIPSLEKSGFSNNSSIINLKQEPELNGKWIIIGFNLSQMAELNKILLSSIFSFALKKKAMQSTWIYPKTINAWYSPPVNNLIGNWSLTNISDSTKMTVSFWINISTIASNYWRSIFHVSNTNNNCCNSGDRVPAAWIVPGQSSLHVRASTSTNGSVGVDATSQLPLNTPVFVTIVFNINVIKVYFSGVINQIYNVSSNMISAIPTAQFYIADPWYSNPDNSGFTINSFELFNTPFNDTQVVDLYNVAQTIQTQESDLDIN
jgi:hypothetical protein